MFNINNMFKKTIFQRPVNFTKSLVKLIGFLKSGFLDMQLILNTTDIIHLLWLNTQTILNTTFSFKLSKS